LLTKRDSNEFKVDGNHYSPGHYVNGMEGDNIDLSSPNVTNHGRGRPVKVPKYRTTVRVQRHSQELKATLKLAYQ
jgi:hypothetical protein